MEGCTRLSQERPDKLRLKRRNVSFQVADSDSEWDFDLERVGYENEEGDAPIQGVEQRDEREVEIRQEAVASPVAARTRARKATSRTVPPATQQPSTPQLSPQERRRRQAAAKKSSSSVHGQHGSYKWIKTQGGRFIKQWVPGRKETD